MPLEDNQTATMRNLVYAAEEFLQPVKNFNFIISDRFLSEYQKMTYTLQTAFTNYCHYREKLPTDIWEHFIGKVMPLLNEVDNQIQYLTGKKSKH
jgi:hypothetical protein